MPGKHVVIWGAGGIGRGFVADPFDAAGYHITFVDQSASLIAQLNAAGRYTVAKAEGRGQRRDRMITGYEALTTDQVNEVAEVVAAAGVVVVAVFPDVFPDVARQMMPGAVRRLQESSQVCQDILLCTNLAHAADLFRPLLFEALPAGFRDQAAARVGVVETVPMRVAAAAPPGLREQEPLLVWTDGFDDWPVDRGAFRGEIPSIPGIMPEENVQAVKKRKVYTYNMCHAVLAYLGALRNYELAEECLADPEIRAHMEGALQEASRALQGEFGFSDSDTDRWTRTVVIRTDNPQMDDRVARLGADPGRKLRRDDRLVGPALLARRHGISPVHLARAVAAGLLFHAPADSSAGRIRQRVEEVGLSTAVREICQLDESENDLTDMIVAFYGELAAR